MFVVSYQALQVLTVEEISKKSKFEKCGDASDDDHDSIDFFGLKAVADPPMVSDITTASDISCGKKLEKVWFNLNLFFRIYWFR